MLHAPDGTAGITAVLSVRGLSRHYGTAPHHVVALDDVDFEVVQGEMVAIMGPSGSGKSTLLSIAGGLETASSGSVEVESQQLGELDMTALADVRRRCIGFVFQSCNLLDGLTAAENVAAPLELEGTPAKVARNLALTQLDAVGLGDRGDSFPDDLSGGERQRVAIARALIGDRRLLLADEPTGALDSATSTDIMKLLREACTAERTVVVVTHDPIVAACADRVVMLRDGKVESSYRPGSPR